MGLMALRVGDASAGRTCGRPKLGDKCMQELLWLSVTDNPGFNISQHVEHLVAQGLDVNRSFVGRIFRSWLWSWKQPSSPQIYT
jgi:hypothetical protein